MGPVISGTSEVGGGDGVCVSDGGAVLGGAVAEGEGDGVGEEDGGSDADGEGEGSSEGSGLSEGEGDGSSSSSSSSRSPKILVGWPMMGVGKVLYSSPSCRGAMTFFHIWAAGLP